MKLAATIALTAAAAQLVLAQPHGHAHHHKKHIQNVSVVKRDMTTIYVNESGDIMALEDVCAGLASKKLRFKDGKAPDGLCNAPEATPTPSTTATPESTSMSTSMSTSIASGAAFYEASATEASSAETSSIEASSTETSSAEPTQTTKASSNNAASPSTQDYSGGQGVNSEFPDGQLDCSTFPSEYGAVAVNYLDLGGWTGVQVCTYGNGLVTDIYTAIAGEGCRDGAMCSYACPPGYLKSQWPAVQGATGQSVGGLECSNGKLKLTNPGLSKSLCVKGTGGVKARNDASDIVSICRTDYPGTESETIPTVLEAGQTQELACPNSDTYYQWKGMATSAQYYLNPIGAGPKDACQWGKAGTKLGNWAPINFGVSKKGQ